MKKLFFLILGISLAACSSNVLKPESGVWLVNLDMHQTNLPFYLNIDVENASAEIINDTERISIDDVKFKGDSLYMYLPFFDSEFHGKVLSEHFISGTWHNKAKGDDYILPFIARFGHQKFKVENTNRNISGNWETTFGTENDSYPAIGKFEQKLNKVTGTFITETGDYRFLDGYITNDSLFLHAFDGAHAFTFNALVTDSGIVNGKFYSGKHYSDVWKATKNDSFALKNPYELTQFVDSVYMFNFRFKNLENETEQLISDKYNGKVKIVQIMGSWCPNCMDETLFYSELYDTYKEKGLEIIALAYERETTFSKIKPLLENYKKETGANYTFLIGGRASKKITSETLPQLSKIISYPTSIFIDRNGKVVKIHTGFYGPGTGKYYEEYKEETIKLIESLL